jgi:DNA-binding FadR family transcriptional regulator
MSVDTLTTAKKSTKQKRVAPIAKDGVRIPKTAEVVANQIRQRIIRGELKEGDALPQETELTLQFRISRPTLREALRILESDGLLDISRGTRRGALIRRPDIKIAARHANLVLQVDNVSLDDDRAYGAALAAFHRTLVDLAGLRSLTVLVDMLAKVIEGYIVTVQKSAASTVDSHPAKVKSMKAKEKLITLIEAHSAPEAEKLWRNYLEISRSIMLRWQPPGGINALSDFLYS